MARGMDVTLIEIPFMMGDGRWGKRPARLIEADAAKLATPDETVIASLGWLARHPHGSIRQLSRWSGISERQMQRRFSAALGYGPKMFQSVLRLQRFLHLSENTSDSQTLADVAASVGYSDQPHMTREVRRFTGSPPTGLPNTAKCTLRFSDLLLGSEPL